MTMSERKVPRQFWVWLALTAVTGVLLPLFFMFAAIPMFLVRRLFGPLGLAGSFLASVGALVIWGELLPLILGVFLYMGVAIYAEMRGRGRSSAEGALAGLVANASLAGGAWWGLRIRYPQVLESWMSQWRDQTLSVARQVLSQQPDIEQFMSVLWTVVPAALAVAVLASLGLGTVVATRWGHRRWGLKTADELKALYDFRNPDALVWVGIVTVLGAYLNQVPPQWQTVCLNLFYVVVFMYFLQGLAVAGMFFALLRVGAIWQGLWFFVAAVHMLPIVSVLGFTDYWVDFRGRMLRRKARQTPGSGDVNRADKREVER